MSCKSVKPMDLLIGRNLKIARAIKGISAIDTAKKLGISQQQFSKYQVGKNRITASRLHEFAEIVGKPVEYFFEEHN